MHEKDTPLALALRENLRLRLMLSALPAPLPNTNWTSHYITWWHRNRYRLKDIADVSPEPAA
jgi:hypothetical protein